MTLFDAPVDADRPIVALQVPLSGSHLIEASAGTGKTWTLSALFVRLVIESDLQADQVLTVTFTRAATAELRTRIRRRLSDLLLALAGAEPDAVSAHLLQGDRERVARRARAAFAAFDSAPIYTIHGFAQRALTERAFSAGVPFDIELGETRGVWIEAVRDFWRNHVATWREADGLSAATHRNFAARLIARGESPEGWAKWLFSVACAVNARIASDAGIIKSATEEDIEVLRPGLRDIWRASKHDIHQILLTHPSLRRNTYSKRNVPRWWHDTDQFVESGALIPDTKQRERMVFLTVGMMRLRLKPDAAAPDHPFFLALDVYLEKVSALDASYLGWRQSLLLKLYADVPERVQTRLSAMRLFGYDDLLVQLLGGLKGTRGKVFATALRTRFPAALIDEFQDTDAIQERIFSSIYGDAPEAPVYLVGDPKQAIYRFRGADIYTYLAAAARTNQRHDLAENHRAVPGLIDALNSLFARNPQVFQHPGIRYRPAFAAKRDKDALVDDGVLEPMPLRFMVPVSAEVPDVKQVAERMAAQAVADEIALMMTRAADHRLTLGNRPLAGGDIAVLVATNPQGQRMRRELKRRGISVADRSRGSVYQSDEADWLLRVLEAILEPHRMRRVRNALATPLYGWRGDELLGIADEEAGWQAVLDQLAEFGALWARGGVLRLLRTLLAELPGAARLSQSVEGERHLTNLFHLGELIHNLAGSGAMPALQCAWLAERIEYASQDVDINEVAELRLESDQDLVQVLTLHKSKGLEFPVVFVPFLFSAKADAKSTSFGPGDMPLAYHDDNDEGQLVIDFGSADYGAARLRVEAEERSEDARLLYVGLTRAIHRCIVYWCTSDNWLAAPIASLLTGSTATPKAPRLDHAGARAYLAEIAADSGGMLGVVEPPATQARIERQQSHERPLAARRLDRALVKPWRLASFSSLQRKSLPLNAAERPDHDQDAPSNQLAVRSVEPGPENARFHFPRGAAAGECLHRVLEVVPFSRDLGTASPQVADILKAHGFAARLAPEVARWLGDVLATPLFAGGFALADVARADQIREMEFHLPLAAIDAAAFAPLVRRHGLAMQALAPEQLEGFLKGFIDLVVVHDGRFYLVDYKSNWLGGRLEDYRGLALDYAMQGGGYTLQYLLYALALVRWLRFRNPAFDYERDFGGICYLFLRGIAPDVFDEHGAPGGIYFARPTLSLIQGLDQFFEGGGSEL